MKKTPSYKQEICKEIKRQCNDKNRIPAHHDFAEWTKYIINIFSQIKPGWLEEYYTSNKGEYLLDYVWSDDGNGKDWWDYHGLVLGMECEWNGSEESFWEDFVKLADVKADKKVWLSGNSRGA